MRSGRIAAFVLVAVSLLAMAFATREWLLVGPLLAALGGAFFARLEGEILFRTYVLLGVPLAVLGRVHPVEGTSELGLTVPFYIALYLEVVAIRKLASTAPNLAHVVFCAASGVAAVGADCSPRVYRAVSLAVMIPLVLSVRGALVRRAPSPTKRPLRGAGIAVATLAVLAVGEGGAAIVDAVYEDVSQAFIRRVARVPLPSAGGFSGAARLGAVMNLQGGSEASSIAIRAFAKRAPGYLRGKSFQDYEKGEWTTEQDGANARPVQLSDSSRLGRLVLERRKAPRAGDAPEMRILPASEYGRYFFLPLRASAIETLSEVVKVAPGGSLESPFDPTSTGYAVFTDREPVRGPAGWTKLPDDPALLAALDGILATIGPRDGPLALVQAVRDWFSTKYTYKYGIDFEKGSDPLVQFLTKKSHGHCELFASAGALLLRRRGVPARYTTGYLCQEKNARSEDLWVARNAHAHAWVEFADASGAWETAEFTPDTGMPVVAPATGLQAWLDALQAQKERFLALVAEQGWGGVLQQAVRAAGLWLVESWPGRALLAALALYVLRRGSKRLPKRAVRRAERALPPALEAERQRYLAHERALRKRGVVRGESETLEEFAARLEPADAAPVRAFAALRYAPPAAPAASAGLAAAS